MPPRAPYRVVVVGAGVAGLTTALALARAGIGVDVLERDRTPAPFGRRGAAGWVRDGAPQVRHAHVFGPRCHRLLATELPDVLTLLLAQGAREYAPTGSGPALAVRRPLFDWVLRRVAEREPGMRVHGGIPAAGARVDGSRLTGVLVPGGLVPADVIVDATGGSGWPGDTGAHPEPPARSGSVTYYSRGYALRWQGEGGELNLGVAAGGECDGYRCVAVPGDNDTVTVTFAVPDRVDPSRVDPSRVDPSRAEPDRAEPDWSAGLAALRVPDGFQAAVDRVPALTQWANPASADPLTPVAVLADWPAQPACGRAGATAPSGVVAVGDARGGPDPATGHGVWLAMRHAVGCAAAIAAGIAAGGDDPADGLEQRMRAAEADLDDGGDLPAMRVDGPSAPELARIVELACDRARPLPRPRPQRKVTVTSLASVAAASRAAATRGTATSTRRP